MAMSRTPSYLDVQVGRQGRTAVLQTIYPLVIGLEVLDYV